MRVLLLLPVLLAPFPAGSEPHTHPAGTAHAALRTAFGGYVELQAIHYRLRSDGAAYQAAGPALAPRTTLDRAVGTLKLTGSASAGEWRLSGRAHLGFDRDQVDHEAERRFDELFTTWAPSPAITVDAGKKALRWGQGHVWNPASFVERPKDPTDPRVLREGYTMLATRLAHALDPSTELTFTPVLIPVTRAINDDFGVQDKLNLAGRAEITRGATEGSFQFLAGGSRSARWGFTFAHAFTSSLDLYGEWARISAQSFRYASPAGAIVNRREAVTSFVAGAQYRVPGMPTVVVELYHNGTGFSPSEFRDFAALADAAAGAGPDSIEMRRAQSLQAGGFGRGQPMRNYLYVRLGSTTSVGPVGLLPSIRTTINLDDASYSITPELLYNPRGGWGWRARLNFVGGGAGSEYGEKRYSTRAELRLHLHF
jgi:hypothetical protein